MHSIESLLESSKTIVSSGFYNGYNASRCFGPRYKSIPIERSDASRHMCQKTQKTQLSLT
jgi:hypothetical protein